MFPLRVVEPTFPALLFKNQLTAFVEKIYVTILDNIKKELSSLISLCIEATYPPFVDPRTTKASLLQISGGPSDQQPQSNHWQKIIEKLDILLKVLQDYSYAGSSWDEMKHISQAVSFLVRCSILYNF